MAFGLVRGFAFLAAIAMACAPAVPARAQTPTASADAAERFGGRQAVSGMRMSPDGSRVAYIVPLKGQGTALMVRGTGQGDKDRAILVANGDPERLSWCRWAANDRLVCQIYGLVKTDEIMPVSRLIAVDTDGGNVRLLSNRPPPNARGMSLWGGGIIDWLPDEDGTVLMIRDYLPNDRVGTRVGSSAQGTGVDRVDTRNLRSTRVEPPRTDARTYISDGRGKVRIMGMRRLLPTGYDSGVTQYFYREQNSREWMLLGTFDWTTNEGFYPIAVDADRDVVFGFQKNDGRMAFFEKGA